MEILLIFSFIFIFVLIIYLFLLKKELRRITCEIKIQRQDTNQLLHSSFSCTELNALLLEMNTILKSTKEEKIAMEKDKETFHKMILNISHDLRTPLTSALGYIDLLLFSNLNKEGKKELKIIEERLKRLEELINSFFAFSKVISDSNKPSLEKVNLVSILEESIIHYYEDYEKKNRTIQFSSANRKCEIFSNKDMLFRVFDNLIGNAFKHSNGNLEIILKKKNEIKIEFKNELSIQELDIEHIFDEFYTVDISRTKGNTGLGLAIVKEFTEELGGSIKATKKKNQFFIVITFPLK